jgi:hypothetical protein
MLLPYQGHPPVVAPSAGVARAREAARRASGR